MDQTSTQNQPIQLRVAYRALKSLINNPEDTRQVFVIIRAPVYLIRTSISTTVALSRGAAVISHRLI